MFILAKGNNKLQGINDPKQSLTSRTHLPHRPRNDVIPLPKKAQRGSSVPTSSSTKPQLLFFSVFYYLLTISRRLDWELKS